MIITSKELWDDIESSLKCLVDNDLVDFILKNKIECLLNGYPTLSIINEQFLLLQNVKVISSVLKQEEYLNKIKLTRDNKKIIDKLIENLKLFEMALLRESKSYEKPVAEIRKRLPNEDNEKALRIFDKIK